MIEEIQAYCLAKKATTESFPFDNDTLVFKVAGKMFAILNLVEPYSITLKCDPDYALELRAQYPQVKKGYHTTGVHWNTVDLDFSLPMKLIYEWIDDSYKLVVAKIPKKLKAEYDLLG